MSSKGKEKLLKQLEDFSWSLREYESLDDPEILATYSRELREAFKGRPEIAMVDMTLLLMALQGQVKFQEEAKPLWLGWSSKGSLPNWEEMRAGVMVSDDAGDILRNLKENDEGMAKSSLVLLFMKENQRKTMKKK